MGAPLISGLNQDAQVEAAVRRGIAYFVNGYDRGTKRFILNGAVTTQNLGLEPLLLDDDMALAAGAAGVMTGTYAGSITLYNGIYPILLESNPSPIETVTVSSKKIVFSWSSAGFDAQVTKVRCYLTIAGAAAAWDQMYLVAEVDASDDAATINLSDALIQAESLLSTRKAAPVGNYAHLEVHKNRLVMANRTRALKASGKADSGSKTTLVDDLLKKYATDYFKDMVVVVRRGDADEERRQVLTYAPATGTLTFTDLTATVAASDTYEIYESSNPTEVVWSPADDPETFPADNAISIDPAILEEVTALVSFHDHVLALGRTAGVAINTETGASFQLPFEFGCISSKTAVRVGGSAIWLAEKGVYQVFPGYGFKNLTDGLLRDFTDDLNRTVDHKSAGVYHGRRYYLAFATGDNTKNDKLWFYDLLIGGWFERDYPFHIMALATVHDEFGVPRLYAGCAGTDPGHKIKLLDIGTSDIGDADPGENVGTVESGSTTTVVDTTQAWTVNQFTGASVRVRRQGSSAFDDAVVASNTATALTFAPALSFTPVAGDSYEIGVFDSDMESAEFDFGAPHQGKRLLWADVEARDEFDADSSLEIGAAKDFDPSAFKSNDMPKDQTFAKVYLAGRGKHFRLVLHDDSPDSPGLVRTIVLAAEVDGEQL